MALKVLLLNFPIIEILKYPSNLTIKQAKIEENPTLHDFHAILVDTADILDEKWWLPTEQSDIATDVYTKDGIEGFSDGVKEQIETGGITFCFSGSKYTKTISARESLFTLRKDVHLISNYFFCPIDLGVVNEQGDTFYPRFEELRYFNPLLKQIPLREIEWSCYFSKVPENARVLGVNRAGYSVFIEVPLGAGKLIMLPLFKNRLKAVTIILNEIIPQMIHEEEFTFVPQWLPDFSSSFEKHIRIALSEIETAKRLLFTKDKMLKEAVAFAFRKLGFEVDVLPDGTLPDLRIADEEQKAIVEVKGHENRQATRQDVLQLLGYLSETDIEEKGIVVSNHEFSKEPAKRSEKAFTDGAIQLGEKNDISLISSINLYEAVMKILEKKLNGAAMKKIRDRIMIGSGFLIL